MIYDELDVMIQNTKKVLDTKAVTTDTGYLDFSEYDQDIKIDGYLDEYDMAYTIESEENKIITIDNYIYAIKGNDITIPKGIKLPNYIKGNFKRLIIESEDDIPEEFCNTEIHELFIKNSKLIESCAFYNCNLDRIHIDCDVEIGEKAFYQKYLKVVKIYSKYDISDYDWNANNIIPIFIKEN